MTPSPAAESGRWWRWINLPAVALIWAYKLTLSPLMGGHCRFVPTCSNYALDVYRSRNPLWATWLIVRRVARCHPWGGGGYDPAPRIETDREPRT